jgi:hypothetical protein
MKRGKTLQRELPVAGEVFNLFGEAGNDPVRLAMEAGRRAAEREALLEFERKMQRTLEECPGFCGAEAPCGAAATGRVLIDPAMTAEAIPWLKRRFHVNENLALSHHGGLCVEVKPRARGKPGVRRGRVSFAKPEQFQLPL